MQAQPNDGFAVKCDQCDSPHVVAMDDQGYGFCARCRAQLLGVNEGEARAALDLLEVTIGHVIERGHASATDVRAAVDRAIEDAERRRENGGLSPVPTWDETQTAADALSEFEQLERGDR